MELQVKGRKDGNTTVLADGTLVVLVPQYGENVEATVVGGKIKVDLAHGIYTVTAGEYEGTLSVVKESLPTEIILGYKFATSTGTAGYGSVDFSMMNETNHSLTLEGSGAVAGTYQYVEAKLNQPDSAAESKYAVVETTVRFNGDVGLWSHRFGIKMTADKGVGVTVLPSDAAEPRLQVFELYAENASDIFAGWSSAYTQYYDEVVAALNGDGLKLRVVRSDTQIIPYAYLNEAWVQFGDRVTCDTNAKTDIRFAICDGSWTFSNTTWRCQYHVVFAPKYRRMVIYREIRADIGKILRQLCQQKGVEIIEAEACPDHIHMLLSIPPKYSVSQIMGFLKGKSSLMIFDRHANLKYKYGNRHFWARGYFVDTVGRNKKQIQEYIKNQLQEDQIADQMSIKEYVDPFTGRENK